MQLTLLVPELIWPEPDDLETLNRLSCPALSTLLTRSRRSHRPPQSLEATMADAFEQPEAPAYGAFRLLGEADAAVEADQGFWMCCDPVHLRLHQDRLILADSSSFDIKLDEALALATDLNQHFAATGRFHVASAARWYLQLADNAGLERIDVPPLSAVAGRSIERFLPETAQARELRKLLTEAQMLLHAHPINQQREDAGRVPINGLWLWGAGVLPPRSESNFDGVWSTHPLARGLARAAGVPTHPIPVDAATLFEHVAADTSHLVLLEDLLGPVQYENGEAFCQALNILEKNWFAPVRTALAKGKIKRLRIEASTAYAALSWESQRKDHWKLWRRPQTLATLAQELAKGSGT